MGHTQSREKNIIPNTNEKTEVSKEYFKILFQLKSFLKLIIKPPVLNIFNSYNIRIIIC